jgi:hypothetical protein
MGKSLWFAACRLSVALAGLAAVGCGDGTTSERTDRVGEALTHPMGVDYSFARPSPSGLHAEGYTFACRYLSPPPNAKNLSKTEADELWAAKVDIVANFEEGATNALSGHAQGVTDAKVANGEANADGIPEGRPIYFSIDFDAQSGDFAAIDAYFDGVASVIGIGRTGAYGGYAIIKHLFDVGKIRWGWQTYAWSAGAWDSRAQLRQVLNDITAAGDTGCCDEDQGWASDFGQWHASSIDPCASAPNGSFCGQSSQLSGGGQKNHLYDCVGGVTKSNVVCADGCIVEPSGKPDMCAHPDGGTDAGGRDAARDAAQDNDGATAPVSDDGGEPDAEQGASGDASDESQAWSTGAGSSGGCSIGGDAGSYGGSLGGWVIALVWLARRRVKASTS